MAVCDFGLQRCLTGRGGQEGRDGAGHNCNGAHSYSREEMEREVREERGREKREGKGGGLQIVSIKALPY